MAGKSGRRWCYVATAVLLASTAASGQGASPNASSRDAQEQKPQPQGPGTLSERLDRSNGVIRPPAHVDPEIHVTPPAVGNKMPMVPPPGTPGADPTVKPK